MTGDAAAHCAGPGRQTIQFDLDLLHDALVRPRIRP